MLRRLPAFLGSSDHYPVLPKIIWQFFVRKELRQDVRSTTLLLCIKAGEQEWQQIVESFRCILLLRRRQVSLILGAGARCTVRLGDAGLFQTKECQLYFLTCS